MKILSIGNSFSRDAHKWLHQVAESAGEDIYAVNLFIGGCSLSTHWEHFLDRAEAYDLEINGVFQRKAALTDTLYSDNWDVITLQQVSNFSGDYSTFEPYLTDLYENVKKSNPNARIYLHKTWAYEIDSEHDGFLKYGRNQSEMYKKICEAYETAAKKLSLGIIPTGDVIQYLRDNTEYFDYKNGGESLNRDGFHLSYLYGRYAAAVTWFSYLCGADAENVTFVPESEGITADPNILKIINKSVNKTVGSI